MVKNLPANAGHIRDVSSLPGSGRSPGRRNVNPLQYSCPENPRDWGAWQATVHSVTKATEHARVHTQAYTRVQAKLQKYE